MAGTKLLLEGRVSVKCFLLGLSVVLIPLIRTSFGHLDWVFDYLTETPGKIAICMHIAVVNGLLLITYRAPLYKIAVRACFLGFTFGCGLIISFSETTWTYFGWYMCSLSFFHYSEYLVTAVINPRSLSLDSFLLNHSMEYTLAAVSSWVEFTVEKLTVPGGLSSFSFTPFKNVHVQVNSFPKPEHGAEIQDFSLCVSVSELKQLHWLSFLGLFMVLCGEGLRKAAMLTAGSNFNHIVQNEKARSHVLVTDGVYAYFRHPSYVGWFYWSIGTQILLCNPVCTLGYTIASWRFFRERIEEEEVSLINFFAEDYVEYKKKVPTGLPFISGIRVN
ncbi:protein-S-isoprenylcysteine O-methyltransferase [Solea senegalensis]|uniref:Protein-S-isoprenylcysteine O-methyltransferase n=1 Tax=Solea senegalensis TaxID=28829 RepID=A0AAV6SUQ7_SOLSE|nr:protein-S-isoprenylcysteine O-methyltransferase [Solea senegalensis]